MITLAFLLDHQVISRSDKNTVVAGSKNYVRARFILRTDDWTRPITATAPVFWRQYMAKIQEIGPYSAYAIAVKYGYKGTEEEWVKEQEANRKAAEAAAAAAAQSAKDAAASASGAAQSGQQAEQPLEDGGTQTIWTCEERQHRVPGSYTAEDVQANFDAWWDYKPTEPEPESEIESRIYSALAKAIHEGVNES